MTQELKQHYNRVSHILAIVLIFNWAVALAKIIYGFLTNSFSIQADGFHSLADGASNIIGIIGITFASQPKDEDHPYGHKKYETLFSLGIGALLFFVSFNLLKESIVRFWHKSAPQIDTISFIIMVSTLLINIFVMLYEKSQGKKLKSDILVADSLHTRSDIFITISVILGLIVIKAGYPIFDPIIGAVISLFIAYSGFVVVREGSRVLCDEIAVVDIKEIENIVLGIKGVEACHKIRTRGRTDDIHVDLHVQVAPNMHIANAHNISFEIETAIKQKIAGVVDVVVHIEPMKRGKV